MKNWSNVECKLTEQKLINYTPYLYLHFIFSLFMLFVFYSIYCYLYFALFLISTLFINIFC